MNENKFLSVSLIVFIALLFSAIFIAKNVALSANLIFLGVLVVVIPYSLLKFVRFKKIKVYEKESPNFLRDIAESQRAGLTISQAIQTVAKNEYGSLTPEIRKMANQLSWNI